MGGHELDGGDSLMTLKWVEDYNMIILYIFSSRIKGEKEERK